MCRVLNVMRSSGTRDKIHCLVVIQHLQKLIDVFRENLFIKLRAKISTMDNRTPKIDVNSIEPSVYCHHFKSLMDTSTITEPKWLVTIFKGHPNFCSLKHNPIR
jgi:hypothetical protein